MARYTSMDLTYTKNMEETRFLTFDLNDFQLKYAWQFRFFPFVTGHRNSRTKKGDSLDMSKRYLHNMHALLSVVLTMQRITSPPTICINAGIKLMKAIK